MLQGFASDACGRHRSIVSYIIFFTFFKDRGTFACHHSSGTLPRAKDSLKISASIGEISLLRSFSTLAFRPSGPGVLCMFSQSNSLATPFGSAVMSPMEENGTSPFLRAGQSRLHM